MANGTTGGGLGGIIQAFGGSDAAPKPKYYQGALPLLRGVSGIGRDVLRNIRGALPDFYSGFERGTEQQRGFQGEQEGVLRSLLARRLGSDPEALLKRTGEQLFSFIDPNVIDPLSRFDVNQDTLLRRARGINPAAVDSTADRLRRSRIASGRYYDVARNVYGILPQVYQQLRDAGITDEQIAAGYIPQIQRGYRELDYAPLAPLQASIDLTRSATGIPADYGAASKANIYGFHQRRNLADRFGAAGQSAWNTIKDAAGIYASLYGGGAGGIGGIGGGGGGGAAPVAGGGSGYPYFQQPGYGAPPQVNPYFQPMQ
jgi:hypothetical protein